MGKAKKRGFVRGNIPDINLTREEAIEKAVKIIENKDDVIELVTLFGITAEELLEAGANYEDVMSLGNFV